MNGFKVGGKREKRERKGERELSLEKKEKEREKKRFFSVEKKLENLEKKTKISPMCLSDRTWYSTALVAT